MPLLLSLLLLLSPAGQRLYQEAEEDIAAGDLGPAEVKLRRALTLVEPEAPLAAWIWLALAGLAEQEGDDCEVAKRYQRYLVYAAPHPDEAPSIARAERRLRAAERRCEALTQLTPEPRREPPPPPPPPPPESKGAVLGGVSLGVGVILLGAAGYELFQAQAGSDEVQTSYQAYQAATEDVEARWRAVERSVDDQRQAATLSGVLLGGALLTLSFGLYQLTRDAEAPRPKADRGGIRWEVSF